MPCHGLSCAQGRQPCATPDLCTSRHTSASATTLHQANSDGTHRDDATTTTAGADTTPTPLPWDWVDDLRDFVVLAPIAAVLCGMAAMSLGALVGWVLKG